MTPQQLLFLFSDISQEEISHLSYLMNQMNDEQKNQFIILYKEKRKKSEHILLMILLAFFGFAGVHRFYLGQIGWGLVYFITWGFFGIGTIIDLISYRSITLEHNKKQAFESASLVAQYVK
ncbi:MAG: TM2 domain-containing protein [Bacteroidia bacterium]|nr:MAG: TM2 domain-containing protein [Bacteroidia bacterium]